MTATHKDTRVYHSGKWIRGLVSDGQTSNLVAPTIYSVKGCNMSPGRSWTGTTEYRVNMGTAPGVSQPVAPVDFARNRSWAKLVQQVRVGPASLGVTFAEGRESLGMIAERLGRCTKAYRQLRRGQFRAFLRTLTIGPKRKHRNKRTNAPKEAANLWLEYSFGWSPLIRDVYGACDALGQPVPGGKFTGTGRQSFSYANLPLNATQHTGTGVAFCKQGAHVFISNPNLYLAQQIGLANPALIAWELVPFSFVVDWVSDVGSFLGSFSDFLGTSITYAYTTYSYHGNVTGRYVGTFGNSDPVTTHGPVFSMTRSLGLSRPYPNISFRNNVGGSLKRAANAASLLVQILTK